MKHYRLSKKPRYPIRFWSSVEYSSIMSPIVNELQNFGYTAEHRFFISSSSYRTANTTFKRLWLRVRMYLIYPLYFLYVETKSQSTHAIVCTNTFYTPFLSTFLRDKQRVPIHLLYDLFPDALISSGKLPGKSLVARAISLIVDATLSRSSANIILGNRLKQHLGSRLPTSIPNEVIPVGTDCSLFAPVKPQANDIHVKTNVLYCGNLGHLHEIDTLKKSLSNARLAKLPLTFHFCGNGAGMEHLKEALKSNLSTFFSNGMKSQKWVETMSKSPIGLVTMRPGAETILLPSKTYSAMGAGQAIIAICPTQSDLADLIRSHDCGWLIEPGDADKFIETLESIIQDPNELERKRKNAQRAALQFYDAPPVAKLWSDLFERLSPIPCQVL